jgi:hypothetical protein
LAVTFESGAVAGYHFRFVRSDEANSSYMCRVADETETLADITARSNKLGAALKPEGDRVQVMAQ